jgi:hypothetical protein
MDKKSLSFQFCENCLLIHRQSAAKPNTQILSILQAVRSNLLSYTKDNEPLQPSEFIPSVGVLSGSGLLACR